MAKWTSQFAAQLAATCHEHVEQIRETWETILEKPCLVEISEPQSAETGSTVPPDLGPGLLFRFSLDDETLLAALPSRSGLLPDWCQQPDAEAEKRLDAFANRLAALLLPVGLTPQTSQARYELDLSTALAQTTSQPPRCRLELTLTSHESSGVVRLVWPATGEDDELSSADPAERAAQTSTDEAAGTAFQSSPLNAQRQPREERERRPIRYGDLDEGLRQLPPYARSLLKITVPIKVTLAETKLPLKRVLQLGPGSIIQFQKSCEDTLSLEAGGQQIAQGEAVKVGDKFGLWITSIALPAERFFVLQGKGQTRRVQ